MMVGHPLSTLFCVQVLVVVDVGTVAITNISAAVSNNPYNCVTKAIYWHPCSYWIWPAESFVVAPLLTVDLKMFCNDIYEMS